MKLIKLYVVSMVINWLSLFYIILLREEYSHTDSDEELIIERITSNKDNTKGILMSAFGIYADTISTNTVKNYY